MTKDTVPIEVHLLDKTYKVACPKEERDELLASADYLSERMQEMRAAGRVVGSERIAVITALNVTHELLKLQSGGSADLPERINRLREITDRIDEALSKNSPSAV